MSKENFDSIFNELETVSLTNDVIENKNQEAELSGIYIFISIDLVNSTIFKTRFTKLWPFVMQSFYRIITMVLGTDNSYRDRNCNIDYVGKKDDYDKDKVKTGGFKVWKLVGDEVLIYHKIVSIREILNTVRIMDFVTRNITDLFISNINEIYGEEYEDFREFENIANRYLCAKTTMWVAECGPQIDKDYPNMFYDSSNYIDSSGSYLDFLGPDIDAGFRLCGYAEKNKIIIAPNLMALLSVQCNKSEDTELKHEIENKFRIVSYVELEDIWEKRLYPVFMYCSNKDGSLTIDNWKSLFEYDESESSKLTKYIFSDSDNFTNGEVYNIFYLSKIYKDLGRDKEIQKLKENFKYQISKLEKIEPKIPTSHHKFEFHISCACYNYEKKKLWVHKHEYHGLSFGCIKIDMNHNYRDRVKRMYKEKYNIEIEIDEEEHFLSFYSVDRKGQTEEILGIIFLVKAKSCNNIKMTKENGWYSLAAIDSLKKGKKTITEFDKVIDKIRECVKDDGNKQN